MSPPEKQKHALEKICDFKNKAVLFLLLSLMGLTRIAGGTEDSVSFRRDVMAVLSKTGCNMGACHGNKNGKYGFKLSLRGENPDFDFHSITGEYESRRINKWIPEASLILAKATSQIAHEGGKRFDKNSKYYRIIRNWIDQGAKDNKDGWIDPVDLHVFPDSPHYVYAPKTKVQIQAIAKFADGSKSNVADMAVYEASNNLATISSDGVVTFTQPGETTIIVRYLGIQKPIHIAFVPENNNYKSIEVTASNFIDQNVNQKLERLRQVPSPTCSDETYLRRVYMDLIGLPPSSETVEDFISSHDPFKRQSLIIELLESREFSEFWASKWADILRVEEKVLDRKGVRAFYQWIQTSIATHKPLDRFAYEIITARGSTYKNPPTNFFRANRSPTQRAVATAQVFLGTRLQCAECHNNPFDRWTQNDYYGWAPAFSSIQFKIQENNRKDGLDKNEFIGEQVLYDDGTHSIENPTSSEKVPARLLGGQKDLPAGKERKSILANWLVSAENRQFAKVQANRVWSHLMGRGLVEPVDDFRSTNPATHPQLLENLTDFLINNNFQIRPLISLIVSSETYQRSSQILDENIFNDPKNYARNIPRRFTGEQILDAQSKALDVSIKYNGYVLGTRASQIPGVMAIRTRSKTLSDGDKFLKIFGKPQRMLTTDEERTCDPNITQAFQLISSPLIHRLITNHQNVLAQLISNKDLNLDGIVEELYLRFLSRKPLPSERAHFSEYISKQGNENLRAAAEDITWALVNSKEFLFRY